MKKPAALASPRIWGAPVCKPSRIPMFFVMSDMVRLPDPRIVFDHLPKGSGIILRHTDSEQLAQLARKVLPHARKRGLKVLLSNDVRLAHHLHADGVHLSEYALHLGAWRRVRHGLRPNFLFTASRHGVRGLKQEDVDAILHSPVLLTDSHPDVQPLGLFRFARVVRESRNPIIALGGISADNVLRIHRTGVVGIAAIGGWSDIRH